MADVERRRLGRTGLVVSALGLGTGGPSLLGQRSGVDEEHAVALVHHALDRGITLFDTAAAYLESERILGAALAGTTRDRYVLCTKFAPVDGEGALRAEEDLARELRRSLERLRTDHVDVLQLHGVTPERYRHVRDRFVPELERLRDAGAVHFLGITESFVHDHAHEMAVRALDDDCFDTIMVAYNLLSPAPEHHVLPEAARRDVGVLVMCAVRSALADPQRLAALLRHLVAEGVLADAALEADPLRELLDADPSTLTAAAYRFAAGHPAVTCVLTGTADRAHLDGNVAALAAGPLPDDARRWFVETFGPVGRNLGGPWPPTR